MAPNIYMWLFGLTGLQANKNVVKKVIKLFEKEYGKNGKIESQEISYEYSVQFLSQIALVNNIFYIYFTYFFL